MLTLLMINIILISNVINDSMKFVLMPVNIREGKMVGVRYLPNLSLLCITGIIHNIAF